MMCRVKILLSAEEIFPKKEILNSTAYAGLK
jgi:hypothetical protein